MTELGLKKQNLKLENCNFHFELQKKDILKEIFCLNLISIFGNTLSKISFCWYLQYIFIFVITFRSNSFASNSASFHTLTNIPGYPLQKHSLHHLPLFTNKRLETIACCGYNAVFMVQLAKMKHGNRWLQ